MPPSLPGPLAGIRILDLTILINGPWATVLLSDMGAEVIKVEDPISPDPYRGAVSGGG
jgi:formyl-CoA transferase